MHLTIQMRHLFYKITSDQSRWSRKLCCFTTGFPMWNGLVSTNTMQLEMRLTRKPLNEITHSRSRDLIAVTPLAATCQHYRHEWPVWPWSLTLWSGNVMWHIVLSWVTFVPHIKRIGQLGSNPRYLDLGTFSHEDGARYIVTWCVFYLSII